MASNLISVNPQMKQLADNAVVAAKEKFGVSLDFTENSLKQLDTLLEQAHVGYKKASSGKNPANISGVRKPQPIAIVQGLILLFVKMESIIRSISWPGR